MKERKKKIESASAHGCGLDELSCVFVAAGIAVRRVGNAC